MAQKVKANKEILEGEEGNTLISKEGNNVQKFIYNPNCYLKALVFPIDGKFSNLTLIA